MAFDNISESASELQKSSKDFIDRNIEYYRLSAFKKLTKGTTSMIMFIIIGAVLFGALLLLTFAMALFIGAWLDNLALGFLILGVFYILVCFIVYFGFKKRIERKVLIKASKDFFDEDDI
ncbi:phage holin family protein [Galbibacter mesophilus]|uniref:phage holin family protein n=1 Tax=Galbibacter mesophilus TaxID=379069 RepID=UPI00191E0DC7|nr:phage holin family protein [Galbibacter mesophilus]MCM5662283.1 YccS/YhfK family membrane protein [Galbibacter mesophilus]